MFDKLRIVFETFNILTLLVRVKSLKTDPFWLGMLYATSSLHLSDHSSNLVPMCCIITLLCRVITRYVALKSSPELFKV